MEIYVGIFLEISFKVSVHQIKVPVSILCLNSLSFLTGKMWVPSGSKNLTGLLTTFCKYHAYGFAESFSVICWNTFNWCHLVYAKLILASPRLWSIQSTSWFDWFFLWIWPNSLAVWVSTDTFTQREGRLHVNLLNEGYSFLLR